MRLKDDVETTLFGLLGRISHETVEIVVMRRLIHSEGKHKLQLQPRRIFYLLAEVGDILGQRRFRSEADGRHICRQSSLRDSLLQAVEIFRRSRGGRERLAPLSR